jgi:ClpX C4-type zinc finger
VLGMHSVCICNECVAVCNSFLVQEQGGVQTPPPTPEAGV